jgi:hypothetical protein
MGNHWGSPSNIIVRWTLFPTWPEGFSHLSHQRTKVFGGDLCPLGVTASGSRELSIFISTGSLEEFDYWDYWWLTDDSFFVVFSDIATVRLSGVSARPFFFPWDVPNRIAIVAVWVEAGFTAPTVADGNKVWGRKDWQSWVAKRKKEEDPNTSEIARNFFPNSALCHVQRGFAHAGLRNFSNYDAANWVAICQLFPTMIQYGYKVTQVNPVV